MMPCVFVCVCVSNLVYMYTTEPSLISLERDKQKPETEGLMKN